MKKSPTSTIEITIAVMTAIWATGLAQRPGIVIFGIIAALAIVGGLIEYYRGD
jgi:hypothetical protein